MRGEYINKYNINLIKSIKYIIESLVAKWSYKSTAKPEISGSIPGAEYNL